MFWGCDFFSVYMLRVVLVFLLLNLSFIVVYFNLFYFFMF